MKRLPVIIVVLSSFCFNQALARQSKDTAEINALNARAMALRNAAPDSAVSLAVAALRLSEKTGYVKGIAGAHLWIGTSLINLSSFDSAVSHLRTAERLFRTEESRKPDPENQKFLARTINNIGVAYYSQSKLPEALEYYLAALKMREKIGDRLAIATSYNNIANVYERMRNYDLALKRNFDALKIREELHDEPGIATSYNNLGNIYKQLKNFSVALKYSFTALHIYETLNDLNSVGSSNNNIGAIYHFQKNFPKAVEYYKTALAIAEKLNDRQSISFTSVNLASSFLRQKKFREAEHYALQGLAVATEIKTLETVRDANDLLSETYEAIKKYDLALSYQKAYVVARDSVFNEENTKRTVRLEMNYEFEKKEAAARLEKEKKEAVAVAEAKKNRFILWSVSGILVLVLAFAIYAYRSYLQKQKANEAITLQKEIIEEKQKEILDSIQYAQRIQKALITSEQYIDRQLKRLVRNA